MCVSLPLTIAISVTISHGVTVRSGLHRLEDTQVDVFQNRTHENKSGDVRYGEQGGDSSGPPCPIHLSLKFKYDRAFRLALE